MAVARDDVIVADGVSKRTRGVWVLRDQSVAVPRNSVFGLVATPPAGTALLKLMAGRDRPDEGEIQIDGFDAWEARAILRHRVAYMPRSLGDYPLLTVGEYLDFFIDSYRVPEEERAQLQRELLELVDLQDQIDVPVNQLAADAGQWLAIARCLINDPDILLLDDPLAPLGSIARQDLAAMFSELRFLGKTVVFTSPQPLDIEDACTHVALIGQDAPVGKGVSV